MDNRLDEMQREIDTLRADLQAAKQDAKDYREACLTREITIAELAGALLASIPCMEAAEISLRAECCTTAADKCVAAITQTRAALARAKEAR